MKTCLLFVFLSLCTSNLNLWAQSDGSIVSENSVIQNLDICIGNPGWDGIMHITLNGQEICNRQLSGGCLLLKNVSHSDFVATKDVSPGDKLLIWASIVGIGNTNVIELVVPEVTSDSPTLMIMGHSESMDQVTAYFNYH